MCDFCWFVFSALQIACSSSCPCRYLRGSRFVYVRQQAEAAAEATRRRAELATLEAGVTGDALVALRRAQAEAEESAAAALAAAEVSCWVTFVSPFFAFILPFIIILIPA